MYQAVLLLSLLCYAHTSVVPKSSNNSYITYDSLNMSEYNSNLSRLTEGLLHTDEKPLNLQWLNGLSIIPAMLIIAGLVLYKKLRQSPGYSIDQPRRQLSVNI